jgi:hypothetical protein
MAISRNISRSVLSTIEGVPIFEPPFAAGSDLRRYTSTRARYENARGVLAALTDAGRTARESARVSARWSYAASVREARRKIESCIRLLEMAQ